MKLMGFNFSKISIEQTGKRKPETKIKTNLDVIEIIDAKSDVLKSKETILVVKFEYSINYTPDYAKLEFEGNIIISLESKEAKIVLKEWKKKKMSEDFKMKLFNIILMKSNVKALQLEEEMNLPYHIPLPSIKPKKE